jgi:ATP-dependent exoDNAse (exonuclease V) alpha subunit
MKPQPEPSTQEVLAGLVERVTYHNAENGFCVLRAKARGHRDVVTVVGHAATIAAGEWITASGGWVNDRTHGQQFKARFLRTSPPTSADGIEKYLSSGMIRGVGPVGREPDHACPHGHAGGGILICRRHRASGASYQLSMLECADAHSSVRAFRRTNHADSVHLVSSSSRRSRARTKRALLQALRLPLLRDREAQACC